MTVYTSPETLAKLLKHEYSRETCREVVTLVANANGYSMGAVLGKKSDGKYAMCIGKSDGTTAVATVTSTDTAAVDSTPGYITFAAVKSALSQKDKLEFKYDGTVYSVSLPSGTLDASALNTAIDAAKDGSGNAIGAGKVTASFSTNDLVITSDAAAKAIVEGKLYDVNFVADSTGEHVACAVLLADVAGDGANDLTNVVVLAHGPAIVADAGLVYDASVNTAALKLEKQTQLAAVGIVTRAAV